jgi:hypothetical protein
MNAGQFFLASVLAKLLAALAEGGVTESHAEKMAQTLGEATGKRQRVRDEANDDLPSENLAAGTLVAFLVGSLKFIPAPLQQPENAADEINGLVLGNNSMGWRVHSMSVNHETKMHSNYSLTALAFDEGDDGTLNCHIGSSVHGDAETSASASAGGALMPSPAIPTVDWTRSPPTSGWHWSVCKQKKPPAVKSAGGQTTTQKKLSGWCNDAWCRHRWRTRAA